MFRNYFIFVILFIVYSFYKLEWIYTRFILLFFSITYFTTKFIFKRSSALPNFAQRFLIDYEKPKTPKILVDLCRSQRDDEAFESDLYQAPSSFICLICNELSCYRHGTENLVNLQPFKGLLVDRTINQSLNELFEIILETYVFNYYDEIQEFKKDERFKYEVRFILKYVTSSILRRLSSLDVNKLIYYKVIPLLIQHFQTFLQGKRQAKSQQFVEKSVLKCYMKSNLLCKNIKSNNEEIKWIRNLVELTMPYILPPNLYTTVSKSFIRELFTCCLVFPLFGLATDPLYVNDILMLIFSVDESISGDKILDDVNGSNLIEILHNYEASPGLGSINYLQFILSLENLNDKLFDPELSKNEIKELYAAQLIYKTYLLPTGSDFLGLHDEQLLSEMKRILDKNYESIIELRCLKPLLEAYEEIYSKLEKFYFPQFLTSDLYTKMIVGSRLFNFLDECSAERFIFNCEDNCEELFENQCDEEDDEQDVYDYGAIDLIDILNADSSSTNEMEMKESEKVRDLSQWKISIDKVDTKIEASSFKYYYVFQIKVEVDNEDNEQISKSDEFMNQYHYSGRWIVERKYDEFYVLDEKLRRFHGNALSRIAGLSSKRTLFKQSLAFLENKKLEFEKYLHELMNIPALKRSELIYNFLKPQSDSTTQQEDIFHSKLVDINLKKMVKTVPAKFSQVVSQERGQHLHQFLLTFIGSTQSEKAKSNLPNLKDIFNYNQESDLSSSSIENEDDDESSPAVNNEFDFNTKSKSNTNNNQTSKRTFKVNSIYDYLIIILTRICNLKSYNGLVVKLLRILQPVLSNTIEYLFHLSVETKLHNLLTRENVNKCIQMLRDIVQQQSDTKDENNQSMTKLEKLRKQKSQDTLNTLQDYFNHFMPAYLSVLNLNNQTGYFIHQVFQYRLLNKQFFYLLFNLVIEDVFPEILDIDKKMF